MMGITIEVKPPFIIQILKNDLMPVAREIGKPEALAVFKALPKIIGG